MAFNILWKALDAIDPDGDGNINIPPDLIDGLIDKLDTKAEQSDLEQEIKDRIDGDKALQDQIDALDPNGDSKVWSEIGGKPTEFPPEPTIRAGTRLQASLPTTLRPLMATRGMKSQASLLSFPQRRMTKAGTRLPVSLLTTLPLHTVTR